MAKPDMSAILDPGNLRSNDTSVGNGLGDDVAPVERPTFTRRLLSWGRKTSKGSVDASFQPNVQQDPNTQPSYAEVQSRWGLGVIKMRIRPRLTADGGATVHSTAR